VRAKRPPFKVEKELRQKKKKKKSKGQKKADPLSSGGRRHVKQEAAGGALREKIEDERWENSRETGAKKRKETGGPKTAGGPARS